jgi:hypothetical protein
VAKYDLIIAELKQEESKLLALWEPVAMRRARVVLHPPGDTPTDITQEHADAIRKAMDALHKAVVILESI